jgi:hypothetical protein
MIERRYSPRVEGSLDVQISCRGERLGRYRTRNACFDGMFLETGQLDLQPSEILDLSLEANGSSCSISAVVVHRSHRGIGVMLMEDCLAYCRLILDAIDTGTLNVPPESAGIVYCRPLLDAIDSRTADPARVGTEA